MTIPRPATTGEYKIDAMSTPKIAANGIVRSAGAFNVFHMLETLSNGKPDVIISFPDTIDLTRLSLSYASKSWSRTP